MKKRPFVVFGLALSLGGCWQVPDVPQIAPEVPTEIEGLDLDFKTFEYQGGVNSLTFINESIGFAGCNSGAIYKTTDGANSWYKTETSAFLPINDIFFVNENEGWAVGGQSECFQTGCVPAGGFILHSTDGGETWKTTSVTPSKRVGLHSVSFVNSQLGFAVGFDIILRTKDGGITWDETIIGNLSASMSQVRFFDDRNGLVRCNAGKLVMTTDGGNSWQVSDSLIQPGANSISIINDVAYSVSSVTLNRTEDFGQTWTTTPVFSENVYSIHFVSETTGFAFGMGDWSTEGDGGYAMGSIHYTLDGGQTWKGSRRVSELTSVWIAASASPRVSYAFSQSTIVKVTLK